MWGYNTANVQALLLATAGSPTTSVGVKNGAAGSGTTLAVTVAGITAGSAILVGVMCDAAGSVSTVADAQGSYTPAMAETSDATCKVRTYYLANANAGSHTITATFSNANAETYIRVIEIKGADTISPIGTTAVGTNSTGTALATAATLTGNIGDTIVAFGGNESTTETYTKGATFDGIDTTTQLFGEYRVLAASVSGFAANATQSASAKWIIQGVTVKLAVVAATVDKAHTADLVVSVAAVEKSHTATLYVQPPQQPPTLIAAVETTWNGGFLSKSVASLTWQIGDVLILIAGAEGATSFDALPSNTGTGLSWTLRKSNTTANTCETALWTATATTNSSGVITLGSNNSLAFGIVVWQWRNSAGLGNTGFEQHTATQTVSYGSLLPNSAICMGAFDWSAGAVGSLAPNTVAWTSIEEAVEGSAYTTHVGHVTDQPSMNPAGYGISSSSTGTISIIGIEVLGKPFTTVEKSHTADLVVGSNITKKDYIVNSTGLTSVSSITATGTLNVAAGDLIHVFVSHVNSGGLTTSVTCGTDSLTKVAEILDTGTGDQITQVWVKENASANAAASVVAVFNNTYQYAVIQAANYSGASPLVLDKVSYNEATHSTTSTGTTRTAVNVTPATGIELQVFATVDFALHNWTATSPYVLRSPNTAVDYSYLDRIVLNSASYPNQNIATVDSASPNDYYGIFTTFKESSGSSDVDKTHTASLVVQPDIIKTHTADLAVSVANIDKSHTASLYVSTGSFADVVYEQGVGYSSGGSLVPSYFVDLPSAVKAHSTLVLFLSLPALNTATSVASVVSSLGNTYTLVGSQQSTILHDANPTYWTTYIYVCNDAIAGSERVTVSTPNSEHFQRAWLHEYSGCDNTTPVATFGFAEGVSGGAEDIPCGTLVLTDTAGMIMAVGVSNSGTDLAGSGYTLRITAGAESSEDAPFSSAGTYTPTIHSAGAEYQAASVALRAAGAAATTVNKTHTASLVVETTTDKTHTASLVVQPDSDKVHTASLVVQPDLDKAHTASLVVQPDLSKTHTADLFVQSFSDKTHTASLYVQTESIKTHTADLTVSNDHDLNHTASLVVQPDLDKTHTASLYVQTETIKTHTADLYVFAEPSISHTATLVVQTESNLIHTASVLVQTESPLTHTASLYVQTESIKTHTADLTVSNDHDLNHTASLTVQPDLDKNHTASLVVLVDQNKSHTADMSVSNDANKIHTADLLVQVTNDKTHTVSLVVQPEFIKTHTADLSVSNDHDLNHTASLYVQAETIKVHTADLVVQPDIQKTHTADLVVVIAGAVDLAHTADLVVSVANVDKTHTATLVVQPDIPKTHTADLVVQTDINKNHTASLTVQTESSLNHTASLYVQTESNLNHTASLYVQAEPSLSHTASAVVQTDSSLNHSADLYVQKYYDLNHTADLVVATVGTVQLNHTADLVVSVAAVDKIHTADVVVEKTNDKQHTASLFVQGYSDLSHTASLVAQTDTSKTHTADLYIQTAVDKTHTASLVVEVTAALNHTASLTVEKTTDIQHTASLYVQGDFLRTHTADLWVRADLSITHTADLLVATDRNLIHTASLTVEQEFQKNHTASLFVQGYSDLSHTASLVIFMAEAGLSHYADLMVQALGDRTYRVGVSEQVIYTYRIVADTLTDAVVSCSGITPGKKLRTGVTLVNGPIQSNLACLEISETNRGTKVQPSDLSLTINPPIAPTVAPYTGPDKVFYAVVRATNFYFYDVNALDDVAVNFTVQGLNPANRLPFGTKLITSFVADVRVVRLTDAAGHDIPLS